MHPYILRSTCAIVELESVRVINMCKEAVVRNNQLDSVKNAKQFFREIIAESSNCGFC